MQLSEGRSINESLAFWKLGRLLARTRPHHRLEKEDYVVEDPLIQSPGHNLGGEIILSRVVSSNPAPLNKGI